MKATLLCMSLVLLKSVLFSQIVEKKGYFLYFQSSKNKTYYHSFIIPVNSINDIKSVSNFISIMHNEKGLIKFLFDESNNFNIINSDDIYKTYEHYLSLTDTLICAKVENVTKISELNWMSFVCNYNWEFLDSLLFYYRRGFIFEPIGFKDYICEDDFRTNNLKCSSLINKDIIVILFYAKVLI